MASKGVSGVGTAFVQTNGQQVKMQQTADAQKFDDILNQESLGSMFAEANIGNMNYSADAFQVSQKSYEKDFADFSRKDIAKAENRSVVSNASKSAEDFKDDMKDVLTSKLDISEEELEDAMETLGLTYVDLISGEGMAELIMFLRGYEDASDLLFDGSFLDLMEDVKAIMENLDISEADLEALLQEADENSLSVTMEDTGDVGTSKEEMKDFDQTASHAQQGQVAYQTVETTVDMVGEQMVQTTYIDVEDIMSQIVQQTKVISNFQETTVEMQLNPAHLGKLYLQMTEKNGQITAQFSAQNESVRQMLESQIPMLKESLQQQGIKVEAVEVTIASHEFEQNLEDKQQGTQEEAKQSSKKQRRFLSADQMEDSAGFLTEEETLTTKMMLENGNRMDVNV